MQCAFKDTDGKQCQAHAVKGEKLCFFHQKDAAKRLAAQSRGGQAKAVVLQNPLEPIAMREASDVVRLLEDTVNQVRAGKMDVKVGNCIGVLSGHLIKAMEVANVVNRVEVIERAILERRTSKINF